MQLNEAPAHKSNQVYRQPQEYHFCQDSILLPLFVAEQIKSQAIAPDFRALDICAGCGVVGLELAYYEPRIQNFDFVEIQSVFKEDCEANFKGRAGFRFLNRSFTTLDESTYDLIIGNPPYFMPGEGKLSGSPTQNQCRFFLNQGPRELIESTVRALKPDGHAYLLMKSGALHGRQAERDLKMWVAGRAAIQTPVTIRGTQVIHLHRNANGAP